MQAIGRQAQRAPDGALVPYCPLLSATVSAGVNPLLFAREVAVLSPAAEVDAG